MRSARITDHDEFFAILRRLADDDYIYRGVADQSFGLKPKAGRRSSGYTHVGAESDVLRVFKSQARRFIENTPEDDWEWLALMQHHGVPTRLLDWTTNPLVAAYFAVESHPGADGAIYVLHMDILPIGEKLSTYSSGPLGLKRVCIARPKHLTDRMAAQSGLFTIHPRPFAALSRPSLGKFIIPKELKGSLLGMLCRLGVNRGSLFPGLDGLGEHLTWEYQKAVAKSLPRARLLHALAKGWKVRKKKPARNDSVRRRKK